MGIARANKNFNSFINGIVTDANEFNAPENAVLDMENVDINSKGEAVRRKGFKQTGATTQSVAGVGEDATQVVEWKGAGSTRDITLAAAQVGYHLLVWTRDTSDMNGEFKDNDSVAAFAGSYLNLWDMVVGDDGALYVFSGGSTVKRFIYDESIPVLIGTQIYPKVRDIWGSDDSLDIDEHPISLSADHHYNLLNQGWDYTKINEYAGGGGTWQATTAYALFDVVRPTTPNGYYYKATTAGTTAATEPTWPTTVGAAVADGTVIWTNQGAANYPSNSQQWFQGRDSSGNFSPSELRKLDFGKSPAPRGRYTFTLENLNRSSIVSGATDDAIGVGENARTGAFYASRLWYGGYTDCYAQNFLLFSQILGVAANEHGDSPYVACYSHNDVTSEYFNEVLPTDGGVLAVPEMGHINRLVVLGSYLLVFTSNGVWTVGGSLGTGFSPTDFSIDKISEDVIESHGSIVSVADTVYYWTESGIKILSPGATTGTWVIQDITVDRFNDGYQTIYQALRVKSIVRGTHDKRKNFIEWTYGTESGSSKDWTHNRILRLNLRTGAFTKYSIPIPASQGISGISLNDADTSTLHYLTHDTISGNHTLRWFTFNDTAFEDYETDDAPAYIETWGVHVGAPDKDKQAQYVSTFLRRTEIQWTSDTTFDYPSGMTMTAWWDWHDVSGTVKKSGPHNIYRMLRLENPPGAGYPVDLTFNKDIIVNKTKIRGKGHSYTLKFDSVAGKDFQFLGWSTPLLVETEV